MESISQDYYVYTYRYPESMGGAIFYVGKGKTYRDGSDRIDDHEEQARRGIQSRKCDTIREIWAAGEQAAKEKVAHFYKEEDAYLYEWGLINMTTYAEKLTNIYRGKGYPHKLGIVHDNFQRYEAFCIQRHQGRGNSAYLAIYHKVSDIPSFCSYKCIKQNMLMEVLDGKTYSTKGYSLIPECNCKYTSMTTEKRSMRKLLSTKDKFQTWKAKEVKLETKRTEKNVHPLVHARTEHNVSLWQLACDLDLGRRALDQIEEWETGKKIPSLKFAVKLAAVLGFSSPEEVRLLCKKWRYINILNIEQE